MGRKKIPMREKVEEDQEEEEEDVRGPEEEV
jgi:hypothetical protein